MARSLVSLCALAALAAACGGTDVIQSDDDGDGGAGPSGGPGAGETTSSVAGPGVTSTGSSASTGEPGVGGATSSSSQGSGGEGGGSGGGPDEDPATCEEAASARTNIGCDFWPTVTANMVWDIFDYALVVTNAGDEPADVTVERDGDAVDDATVAPGDTHTFYLPWVRDLKGVQSDCAGNIPSDTQETVLVRGGAYHVTSTVPVALYQFSSIEYSPASGGPPGKDWSACPANACADTVECFSYSNDASLVVPSTSLGTTYRVVAYPSWDVGRVGSFLSIVALEDDTTVDLDLSPFAAVIAGDGIDAIDVNGTGTLSLDAGDVAQLIASTPGDFSGTLVTADRPIQVMSGIACTYIPDGFTGCDHLEETLLPVDALGTRVVVPRPTGPDGVAVDHIVRIVGQVDQTTLSYAGNAPFGAPLAINEGQLVDLGRVTGDFEILASQPIAVSTFQLGASAVDPGDPATSLGDPSQSMALATSQFRRRYDLVAPEGWLSTYLDVTLPTGATATLDGAALGGTRSPVSPEFDVVRVLLSSASESHVLTADVPVGVQVLGYGEYASYQYPGGARF